MFAVVCSTVRTLVSHDAQGTDLGMLIVLSACVAVVIIPLMIPIRIRFGGDQGRIILYAVMAVFALGFLLLSKVFPEAQEQAAGFFVQLGTTGLLLLAAGAALVFITVGYTLGVRWVKKKEF